MGFRRYLRCLQRRPYRLLRGRPPPVRLRRCWSPHRDGEARGRGQALRRAHPHRHEEVNKISRMRYYKLIIDLFREFASSTSPEEKESAERRRSNYIPTILFLLMSMSECRMEKKGSWGGEGDFRTRGIRVRVYMRMYMQRCGSRICHALFFSLCYLLFSLSRRKLKKKPKLFIPHVFFFYKEVYLLIVIF